MRLFIGYTPPSDILEKLEEWTLPLRRADFPFRFLKNPVVHLTLHFLGKVDASRQKALTDSLETELADIGKFPIHIDELGAFSRNGSVSILWAGVKSDKRLSDLHRLLGRSIGKVGLPLEDRPFSPHITLARPRSDAGRIPVSQLSPYLSAKPHLECLFDHLTLFSSELSPQGARYRKQKEFRFE